MTNEAKITDRFWEELQAKPMVMLGIAGDPDGHLQPMTAQFEGRLGPIWFFASKDDAFFDLISPGSRAIFSYTAPGHELYAGLHGLIFEDYDRKVIDRFWSKTVAAWYEGGKDDPKLALLRFEPDAARIWLGDPGLGTMIKAMLKGPKAAADDMMADVRL